MIRSRPLWLALLAGCPAPAPGPQSPVPPAPASAASAGSAGCPAASGVHVASYLTHETGGTGYIGWVLPLHDRKIAAGTKEADYATIDAATAQSLGVPAAPPSVWLMTPGQAPCRATAGHYYGAMVEGAVPNVTYGVELSGCAAPPQDQQQDAEAIALVSDAAPTECQVLTPQPVAGRVGETDAQQRWQRPTKETPIPAAVAPLIPPHECRPPGCETLWAFAQVDVAGRPVAWAGAVNWLTIPPGTTSATQCDWKAETFAGFFVAGPDGRAVKVTEGQDHPLLLTAVLADATGPRALLAEGAGEYTTYDLGGGGARVARHLVWLALGPEAYAIDERIGPQCSGQGERH